MATVEQSGRKPEEEIMDNADRILELVASMNQRGPSPSTFERHCKANSARPSS